MPARTIKGPCFAIIVDGKRIIVKHVRAKGKRCRVIVPTGVLIETCHEANLDPMPSPVENSAATQ